VFAAFFAVAVVPFEARDRDFHESKMSIVHTFVNYNRIMADVVRIVEHAAEKVA
jgi:hypothetical protein